MHFHLSQLLLWKINVCHKTLCWWGVGDRYIHARWWKPNMYTANLGSKLPLKWNQTATVCFSLVGRHHALSGGKCWLVSGWSHTLSALSPVMGLSQTSPPSQHCQFKAVTTLLIRRMVQLLSLPGWAGFWLDPCSGSWWGCLLCCFSPGASPPTSPIRVG